MTEEAYGNSQYFTALHNLRENMRKFLKGDVEMGREVLAEMNELAELCQIHGATDPFLKSVFEEVMRTSVNKLAEAPVDMEALREFVVPEGVFDGQKVQSFVDVQKELKKLDADLKKYLNKKTSSQSSAEETAVGADSVEVAALKAESRAYLESKRKKNGDSLTDELLEKIDGAESITVKNKDGKLTVVIDKQEIACFAIGGRGSAFIFEAGKSSKFGCISSEVAAILLKSKSKAYKTAKGEAVQKDKNKQTRQENKQKELVQKREETERDIKICENKLKFKWQSMVKSLDAVEGYHVLADNKGTGLLDVCAVDRETVNEFLIDGIMKADKLWAFYQKKEETGSYNVESEYSRLQRGNFEPMDIQDKLQAAFHEYQNGGKTALPLLMSKIKSYTKISELPEAAAEQYLIDEAYKFAIPKANENLDAKKIEFMNKIMENSGYRMRFTPYRITAKCAGKLNDEIHQKDDGIKRYKKKMVGLMYQIGRKQEEKKDVSDLLYNSELRKVFEEACKAADASGNWETFIKNADNLKKSQETFRILNEEYGRQSAEKMAKCLLAGDAVKGDSLHHVTNAYYASLMGSDAERIVADFNSRRNTVEVLPPKHPAFEDIHKDVEHRFDIGNGGSVLVERDGQIMLRTINTCQVGDVLQIPVLERADERGKFSALMKSDMLFMTSSGRMVKEPDLGGGNSGRGLVFASFKDGRE